MLNAILQVMERKELSDGEAGRIRGLREVGHSTNDIARRLKRPRICVEASLQFQQVKSTKGRPTLFTSRDLLRVVREAATGSYTSIQSTDKLEIKCCVRTVRRILLGVYWLANTKMDCILSPTREHEKVRQLKAKSHVMTGTD